jgi:hypothetical protein
MLAQAASKDDIRDEHARCTEKDFRLRVLVAGKGRIKRRENIERALADRLYPCRFILP